MTVVGPPSLLPSIPPLLDRHSRVSGNPHGTEKTSPLPPNRRRIPAYAGMTVGAGIENHPKKIFEIAPAPPLQTPNLVLD